MSDPWKDPRTGIWKLRKRVPAHLRVIAGRGETIKISTGTADKSEMKRRWPGVLRRWQEMVDGWERQANATPITFSRAAEIAATWAAWIAGGAALDTGGTPETAGRDSDIFDAFEMPQLQEPDAVARAWDRIEFHADEALRLVGASVTEDTRPILLEALRPAVRAAYLSADLRSIGVTGTAPPLRPLEHARAILPAVEAPLVVHADSPATFKVILGAWKAVAVVKPRTVTETGYVLDLLEQFVGHHDAARVTVADMRRWRDAGKVEGITNTTWNNRLSLIRQVFAHAVGNGILPVNPADNALRLKKNRTQARLPYSDEDAVAILRAARLETKASLRWAHWIMAFTGMRGGEVLQLIKDDIRCEGGIWVFNLNEDDPSKSIKTGVRRNVPIHPALIAEGLLAHVSAQPAGAPIFPDKGLDRHGNRGGRSWNVTGKWVRNVVGITDPAKVPQHAWRHRMEDELRAANVPEEVRDAILGHARKTTGRHYGVRGESLQRLAEAVAKVPVPPGL